jgi:hypothetical protein
MRTNRQGDKRRVEADWKAEERQRTPATYEEARHFGEPVFKSIERDRRGRFVRRPAYRKS